MPKKVNHDKVLMLLASFKNYHNNHQFELA